MLKKFSSFLGHDLKTGCRIISVSSGVIAIFLATFFFFLMAIGLGDVQNPDFAKYGSVNGFATVCALIGLKQITHLIFCVMMFTGSKTDNVYALRAWLKSNVIGLCVMLVLGVYCTVLLFAGGAPGLGVASAHFLLLAIPTKVFFGLVVNSQHSLLAPGHIWGTNMSVSDNVNVYPRSCVAVYPRVYPMPPPPPRPPTAARVDV